MTKYLILLFCLIYTTFCFGQKKLILKKGLKRHVLKVGKTVGVTNKNEEFKYWNWGYFCEFKYSKDTNFKKGVWTLDSINKNYIVLKQLYNQDSSILIRSKTINLDSIALLTFSKSENCDGMGFGIPLASLALIIGSPIGAFKVEELRPILLIVGETLGLGIAYFLYKELKGRRINTYDLKEWKLVVK